MTPAIWVSFLVGTVALLVVDQRLFSSRRQSLTIPEAIAWSGLWLVVAAAFGVLVYFLYEGNWASDAAVVTSHLSGRAAAIQFMNAYLLERSLAVDNIFVIAMIFAGLQVPLYGQHRVLYWGIIGAIVFRAVMIAFGAELLALSDWTVYVFGGLLLAAALKMLIIRHDNIEPGRNVIVQLVRRVLPVSNHFDRNRFASRVDNRVTATPLLIALVLVGTSNVLFGINSVPAAFAVTEEPFLVFSSNVFAVLGLRALYFSLAGAAHRLLYFKLSLGVVLAFVGIKTILSPYMAISSELSLGIVSSVLAFGIASALFLPASAVRLVSPLVDDLDRFAVATHRQGKRVVILIFGLSVSVIGIALLVLPGPGLVVIVLGLATLAVEFTWARRWLTQLKTATGKSQQRLTSWFRSRGYSSQSNNESDTHDSS